MIFIKAYASLIIIYPRVKAIQCIVRNITCVVKCFFGVCNNKGMVSDLGEILSKRAAPEPQEFGIIRKFIQEKFYETPDLQISGGAIIVSVPGSALAGTLRFHMTELKQLLPEKTQLIIRSN